MAQSSSSSPRDLAASISPSAAIWIGAGTLVCCLVAGKPKLGLTVAAAAGALVYQKQKASAAASRYTASASFLVNATCEQAYQLWRNFAQLPRFMSHLKRVTILDATRSEWVAAGPLDQEVVWQAEIVEDVVGQRISWKSLPGAQVANSGSVEFSPDPQGRGSYITAQIIYELPLGPLAKGLITAVGKNPQFVLKEDLRRFKCLLEAGEAPTTTGQSHGPRGLSGEAARGLFRESSNQPGAQASQGQPAELQPA